MNHITYKINDGEQLTLASGSPPEFGCNRYQRSCPFALLFDKLTPGLQRSLFDIEFALNSVPESNSLSITRIDRFSIPRTLQVNLRCGVCQAVMEMAIRES